MFRAYQESLTSTIIYIILFLNVTMASTFKRDERTYLPEFVYGATDGAVTTFAVVTGCIGA